MNRGTIRKASVITLIVVTIAALSLGFQPSSDSAAMPGSGLNQAYLDELVLAQSHHTGHVQILPMQAGEVFSAPSCLADGKLPPGVTYTNLAGQCLVTVNWSQNHVLAYPTLDGKNALNLFDSKRRPTDGPADLTLAFPVGVHLDLYVYNRSLASQAKPLPVWLSDTGIYRADAIEPATS